MRIQKHYIAHAFAGLFTEEQHHKRRVIRPITKRQFARIWQKTANVQVVYNVHSAFDTSLILIMFLVQHVI
jgi:hypothetical protein